MCVRVAAAVAALVRRPRSGADRATHSTAAYPLIECGMAERVREHESVGMQRVVWPRSCVLEPLH